MRFYLTQRKVQDPLGQYVKNTTLASSNPPMSLLFKAGKRTGHLITVNHTVRIDLNPISNGTSITIHYEYPWIPGGEDALHSTLTSEIQLLKNQFSLAYSEDPRILPDLAEKAERAGRYEDAAKMWEKLNNYERAGTNRAKARPERLDVPASNTEKTIIEREVIVKVPCKYCGSLNVMTDRNCYSCGASIQ